MEEDEHLDDSHEKVRQKLQSTLQECQKLHELKSCFPCLEVIGCEKRNAYVNAVYASMNKGHAGGFDF
jgi:hypothetical protein